MSDSTPTTTYTHPPTRPVAYVLFYYIFLYGHCFCFYSIYWKVILLAVMYNIYLIYVLSWLCPLLLLTVLRCCLWRWQHTAYYYCTIMWRRLACGGGLPVLFLPPSAAGLCCFFCFPLLPFHFIFLPRTRRGRNSPSISRI